MFCISHSASCGKAAQVREPGLPLFSAGEPNMTIDLAAGADTGWAGTSRRICSIASRNSLPEILLPFISAAATRSHWIGLSTSAPELSQRSQSPAASVRASILAVIVRPLAKCTTRSSCRSMPGCWAIAGIETPTRLSAESKTDRRTRIRRIGAVVCIERPFSSVVDHGWHGY